mgnify:CR=1 FL=1
MTDGFHPQRRGGVMATFSGFEADLLRSLASQLIELLRNEAAVPAAETGVGAIATQAYANLSYRADGLALLRD